jgi:anti-sigma regulatory factor (Ser/Thr protein kinase)
MTAVAVSQWLPAEPVSVVRARRLAEASLAAWDALAHVHDLALITSELVANAVRHAASPLRLVLRRVPGGMLVEVSDEDPRHPVVRVAEPSDPRHRGMFVVEALSSTWGVVPTTTGKCVWAELAFGRRTPPEPDARETPEWRISGHEHDTPVR